MILIKVSSTKPSRLPPDYVCHDAPRVRESLCVCVSQKCLNQRYPLCPYSHRPDFSSVTDGKAHTAPETTIHMTMYSISGLELINGVVRGLEYRVS